MKTPLIDHAFTSQTSNSKAVDPNYAGALSFMRRPFSKDVAGADVVVWGIPFDGAVSNRPGARFGPQAIRRASAIFDNEPQYPFSTPLFEKLSVIDYGDCLLDFGNHHATPQAIEDQASEILKSGAFLYSMGGDHFVTYPLLKAHYALHGPMALIHFDAHQDTWFDDGKRIDHGSFITRAVREGLIDVEHSIQIGIRTDAPEHFAIKILKGFDLEDMSAQQIAQIITAHVGNKKTYLTFDIDCLDPAFAPGTGTPVAGGPSSAKMLSVLQKLGAVNLIGSDIVEVAPCYDHADITAIAGSTIAMYILCLLANRKFEKNSG